MIASLFNRGNDIRIPHLPGQGADIGTLQREIDAGLGNAGQFAQCLFHTKRAVGTGHAINIKGPAFIRHGISCGTNGVGQFPHRCLITIKGDMRRIQRRVYLGRYTGQLTKCLLNSPGTGCTAHTTDLQGNFVFQSLAYGFHCTGRTVAIVFGNIGF